MTDTLSAGEHPGTADAGASAASEQVGGVVTSGVRLRTPSPLDRENFLRARLGLLAVGERLARRTVMWGWLGPLLMAGIAAFLRLWNLSHPDRIMFDETYYVKDALTLDTYGYSTKWYPDDEDHPNANFNQGDFHEMSDEPAYVVHGELGKWFIAIGMRAFGADNPFGWRFTAAIAGVICVILVGRIAMRLFRSAGLATLAAGLLAIDSNAIALSRIALLDVFLAVLVLAGFLAVLKDRESSRAHLARRHAAPDWWQHRLGPGSGFRWRLIIAGILLGASAGVKWSGFYAAAVLGIAAWLWDLNARQLLQVPQPALGSVIKGGLPAFLALVPATVLSYLASWFSWFTHENSYLHQWAANERAAGREVPRDWLPDTLNSFLEYHIRMATFHSGLESEHTYEAHPATWLLQIRPTSMYWQEYADQDQQALCGADRCIGAISSLGNPFLWWAGVIALVLVVWMAARWRDGRAGVILTGYAATYFPWLLFSSRTVFHFYVVTIGPFVVLAVVYAIGLITQQLALAGTWDPEGLHSSAYLRFPGPRTRRGGKHRRNRKDRRIGKLPAEADVGPTEAGVGSAAEVEPEPRQNRETLQNRETGQGSPRRRLRPSPPEGMAPLDARSQRIGITASSVLIALIVLAAIFWWPVTTGVVVPYDFWRLHMWLPTWV